MNVLKFVVSKLGRAKEFTRIAGLPKIRRHIEFNWYTILMQKCLVCTFDGL